MSLFRISAGDRDAPGTKKQPVQDQMEQIPCCTTGAQIATGAAWFHVASTSAATADLMLGPSISDIANALLPASLVEVPRCQQRAPSMRNEAVVILRRLPYFDDVSVLGCKFPCLQGKVAFHLHGHNSNPCRSGHILEKQPQRLVNVRVDD